MPLIGYKLVFLLENYVQRYTGDLIWDYFFALLHLLIKLHKMYYRFYGTLKTIQISLRANSKVPNNEASNPHQNT